MDKSINLNTTYETDSRSPLKELYVKNIKPEETSDNQHKNVHLLDMESTILQDSLLCPAEFASNHSDEFDETIDSNQENQKPRYSVLCSFDPIKSKEIEQVKLSNSINDDVNVLKSGDENPQITISDSPNAKTILVNSFLKDFVEQAVEIPAAVNNTGNSFATELNRSSVSDISVHSNNSALNDTVILNNLITVENNTSNNLFLEGNRSLNVPSTSNQNNSVTEHNLVGENSNGSQNFSATLVSSDLSLTNTSDRYLVNEQNLITEDNTLVSDISLSSILKIRKLSLNDTGDSALVVEQYSNTEEQANKSLNLSSTSKSNNISVTTSEISHLIKEQNSFSKEQTLILNNGNNSLNVTFNNLLLANTCDSDLIKELNTEVETSDADISNNSSNVTSTLNNNNLSSTNKIDGDLVKESHTEVLTSLADNSNTSLDETFTLKSNNLCLTNTGNSDLVKESNTEVQTSVTDNSNNSLNESFTCRLRDLFVTGSVDSNSFQEQNIKTVIDHRRLKEDTESGTYSIANNSCIDKDSNKLVFSSGVYDSEKTEIINDNKHILNEHIEIEVNESKIENKLQETVDLKNKCETNLFSEQILNQHIKTAVNKSELESKSEINADLENNYVNDSSDYSEIPHEISVESLNIIRDLIVEQEEEKSNVQVIDINEITISLNEEVSVDKAPEIDTNRNKNISFETNKSNLQINEILNEVLNKENKKECSGNKHFSFEGTDTSQQTIEVSNEINNDQIKEQCCPTQSSSSTYENKIITDTAEKLISLSTIAIEETHMSATEPNSGLSESNDANRLSLETSAACTNEMGEVINQNECFEKQTDITNGAIDNRETMEAKARVYKEMTEKYAIVEVECEKYKDQVADLKKELKSCRQKSVALEVEVADLKRRQNELNVLLEEYKQAAASKADGNNQDEQLQTMEASEEALKNEVNELKALVRQHETHLKELQRKEVKLADDLSCKTQSEMQISRVMEEYEKSISSLISENEKMKKERDTAQMHLANIEMAFSDVHQKYERCKALVQGYKDNEESFKQDIAMNRETIVIQEQKYETLKAHAMAQLEKSNQELTAMKKQHDTEMARLTAQLKRYEIKNMSLMESLQQKAKECEQLSAVCDEFIGNV